MVLPVSSKLCNKCHNSHNLTAAENLLNNLRVKIRGIGNIWLYLVIYNNMYKVGCLFSDSTMTQG